MAPATALGRSPERTMQCPTELPPSYSKNIFLYVRQRTEGAVFEVENMFTNAPLKRAHLASCIEYFHRH
jgi:hypothetical protein